MVLGTYFFYSYCTYTHVMIMHKVNKHACAYRWYDNIHRVIHTYGNGPMLHHSPGACTHPLSDERASWFPCLRKEPRALKTWQKMSETGGLLVKNRERQRPLRAKGLKHNYVLVWSLSFGKVHDVNPHN